MEELLAILKPDFIHNTSKISLYMIEGEMSLFKESDCILN